MAGDADYFVGTELRASLLQLLFEHQGVALEIQLGGPNHVFGLFELQLLRAKLRARNRRPRNRSLPVRVGRPFRLVLFADAGGVFTDSQSLDFDQMRKSTGVELRLAFKKLRLPLRLIYANILGQGIEIVGVDQA